jgi:hypothetical protein
MYIEHRDKTTSFSKLLKRTIWRYIDFSKYVDLLDSKCLFFPRLSILRKDDSREGSFILFFCRHKLNRSAKKSLKKNDEILPSKTFVSCWYLNNSVSAALWKLHSNSNDGIVIKSTVERLDRSLMLAGNDFHVIQGPVVYGHEKVIGRKTNNPKSLSFSGYAAIFTKRQCFKHEKELRLAIYSPDLTAPVRPNRYRLPLKVDLDALISEIIISPKAPRWIKDLVKRVTKKYGFPFKIK